MVVGYKPIYDVTGGGSQRGAGMPELGAEGLYFGILNEPTLEELKEIGEEEMIGVTIEELRYVQCYDESGIINLYLRQMGGNITLNPEQVDALAQEIVGRQEEIWSSILEDNSRELNELRNKLRNLLISLVEEKHPGYYRLYEVARDGLRRLGKNFPKDRKIQKLLVCVRQVTAISNQITQANLRLVVSIAKGYLGRGLSFGDLIQEGNLGLMKAVDRFNPKLGIRFGTYAFWWIRQTVTRAIIDQARTIRFPIHVVDTANMLKRVSCSLAQELGREPTSQELAERAGLSLEKVHKILKAPSHLLSLDNPIGDDGNTLGNLIEDKKISTPLEAMIRSDLVYQIDKVLDTLTPREGKILRMRFGIGDETAHTLEGIGRKLGVTRERIRQIEKKALGKLRRSSCANKLRLFIDEENGNKESF